jgi:hypothetical protein
MQQLIALTLVLLSAAAVAEEWVAVRTPSDPGQAGLPSILVDTSSIEILDAGIRRARVRVDFLTNARIWQSPAPKAITTITWLSSYDCPKRMRRNDSMESHMFDGSVLVRDAQSGGKWEPVPEDRWTDPTIDFICRWQGK